MDKILIYTPHILVGVGILVILLVVVLIFQNGKTGKGTKKELPLATPEYITREKLHFTLNARVNFLFFRRNHVIPSLVSNDSMNLEDFFYSLFLLIVEWIKDEKYQITINDWKRIKSSIETAEIKTLDSVLVSVHDSNGYSSDGMHGTQALLGFIYQILKRNNSMGEYAVITDEDNGLFASIASGYQDNLKKLNELLKDKDWKQKQGSDDVIKLESERQAIIQLQHEIACACIDKKSKNISMLDINQRKLIIKNDMEVLERIGIVVYPFDFTDRRISLSVPYNILFSPSYLKVVQYIRKNNKITSTKVFLYA